MGTPILPFEERRKLRVAGSNPVRGVELQMTEQKFSTNSKVGDF
jgi:hypothetical protein